MNGKAKELAEAHFEGYIKNVLRTHGINETVLNIVSFHYKSAFVHGFKHGIEEIKESKNKRLTNVFKAVKLFIQRLLNKSLKGV
jgi:hypothetical protein